ncbi:MAG: 2-succinyl-5-enolpyruvyl-6-hydroxy-3-cyclohexene-1-carboxylic-acid synthase [Actinomycetota bacterium]
MHGPDDLIGGELEGDIALACTSLLVDELVRGGMRHACLSPGSRSTPIALALARRPELTVHVHLDERSSAFFALGIAKATGALVAVACTSGTAAAEFLPAVVEASQSRTPLVVLTADRPPSLQGSGANQTIVQEHLYGSYVRAEIATPLPTPDLGADFRQAGAVLAREALRAPPGPVHANLPFRERLTPTETPVEVEDRGPRPVGRAAPSGSVAEAETDADADADGADRAAEVILGARRGVVLLGTEGSEGSTEDDIELARRLEWPVIAEPTSGARLPWVALTAGTLLLGAERWVAAHPPEVVLQIGATPLTRAARSLAAEATELVVVPRGHLDPDPLGRAAARAPHSGQLLERIPTVPSDPAWLEEWRRADAAVRTTVDELLDGWDEPFEGRIARDLAASIPSGTLVAASSMPIRDLDAYAAPRDGLRVLANRGASGIDGFVSTVLGVAATEPDTTTYALCGDLSFVYDLGALTWSGRREDLNVVIVVPNNDGGMIFSFLDQATLPEHERLFTTPHGLDLGAICAAVGVTRGSVSRGLEFATVLRRAGTQGGVQVVEVAVDRENNVRRHAEIQAAAQASLLD